MWELRCQVLLELGLLERSALPWEERGLAARGCEHRSPLLLEMELLVTVFHVVPIWVWKAACQLHRAPVWADWARVKTIREQCEERQAWRWRRKRRSTWICVLPSNYIESPGFSHWNVTVSENRLMAPVLCLLGTLTHIVAVVLCCSILLFPCPSSHLPGRRPGSLWCGHCRPQQRFTPVSFDAI